MIHAEPWTIGRLLNWTTDYLARQGAHTPRLDAEVLLAEARGCERIELYTCFDDVVDERVRTAFRELVRRRAEGTPVAYLTGRREFFSLSFRVTPDVLIPRPETELLVVELLDLCRRRPASASPARIADVGAGSGIIAVAAAKHFQNSQFTAIDVSPAALAIARENAAAHGVAERIEIVESDLFAGVEDDRRFDFVASNPPYVSSKELEELSPEVRRHEPLLALEAGEQGTDVIQRLVPQAADRLTADGWLLIEISPMIESAVHELITADGRYDTPRTVKDLAGHPRLVLARRM